MAKCQKEMQKHLNKESGRPENNAITQENNDIIPKNDVIMPENDAITDEISG